jgi:small subunit ribosomal protein S5
MNVKYLIFPTTKFPCFGFTVCSENDKTYLPEYNENNKVFRFEEILLETMYCYKYTGKYDINLYDDRTYCYMFNNNFFIGNREKIYSQLIQALDKIHNAPLSKLQLAKFLNIGENRLKMIEKECYIFFKKIDDKYAKQWAIDNSVKIDNSPSVFHYPLVSQEKIDKIDVALCFSEKSSRSRPITPDIKRERNRISSDKDNEFCEKLVKLNRTAKVVKGGRRFSFSALTVVGDRKGRVGYGNGKANDVSEAIRKSIESAKRNMISLPIKNGTIPHEIYGTFKASRVILKPACPGTGIIAGGTVRAVMEASGITNVLSKSLGASNQYNVLKATFNCIRKMMDAKTVARNRGKSIMEMWG